MSLMPREALRMFKKGVDHTRPTPARAECALLARRGRKGFFNILPGATIESCQQ